MDSAVLRSGLCLGAMALAPACYTGFQSTSSIVQSAPIDPEAGRNATLSYAMHTYELTGGVSHGRLEFFGGAGLGSQQVNIRTQSAAEGYDDVAFRMHVGTSLLLAKSRAFAMRGFLIYGTQAASFFGADLELNELSSSYEGGVQLSARLPSKSLYLEPLVRIGVAAQSGSTEPELYQDGMGGSSFDGLATTVSLGINFGFSNLLER